MWLSLHVHHGDHPYGRDIDRLLVLAIAPLLERLSAQRCFERYFFIRYRDPECHMRLRLEVRAGNADFVEEAVRSTISTFMESEESANRSPVSARVERVPYVPEVERYGGRSGMRLAERHFLLSSTIALQLLAETLEERISFRVGKALLLAVILVASVYRRPRSVAAFLAWYAESYLRHFFPSDSDRHAFRHRLAAKAAEVEVEVDRAVRSLLSARARGHRVGIPILDQWSIGCRRLLRGIHRRPSAARADLGDVEPENFLASLLHMHNNRLGLSIPQEVHLTHLAATSLARQEVITP